MEQVRLRGQSPDLRPRALVAQQVGARCRARASALGSPTIGWLRVGLPLDGMATGARLSARACKVPLLLFAAGNDRIVSTRAIEEFGVAAQGRHARSCCRGSRHEILQESRQHPQRFWAAFDAYLGVDEPVALSGRTSLLSGSRISSACSCRRGSPAATMRPPCVAGLPSHVVMRPPARSMIGISATTS